MSPSVTEMSATTPATATEAPRSADWGFWAKLAAAGALCGASVLAAQPLLAQPAGGPLSHLLTIASLTLIVCLGYCAALLIARVAEARALLRWTFGPKQTPRPGEANP